MILARCWAESTRTIRHQVLVYLVRFGLEPETQTPARLYFLPRTSLGLTPGPKPLLLVIFASMQLPVDFIRYIQ